MKILIIDCKVRYDYFKFLIMYYFRFIFFFLICCVILNDYVILIYVETSFFFVWCVCRGFFFGWGGGLIFDWWGKGLEFCGTGRFGSNGGGSFVFDWFWGFFSGGGEYFVLYWDWGFVFLYFVRRFVNENIKWVVWFNKVYIIKFE